MVIKTLIHAIYLVGIQKSKCCGFKTDSMFTFIQGIFGFIPFKPQKLIPSMYNIICTKRYVNEFEPKNRAACKGALESPELDVGIECREKDRHMWPERGRMA